MSITLQAASGTVPVRQMKSANRRSFPLTVCNSSSSDRQHSLKEGQMSRREQCLSLLSTAALLSSFPKAANADDDEAPNVLCNDACVSDLSTKERVTLPSGLSFQDIKVGGGPAPPIGYQVVLHYILMTPEGRIISNSLEKGTPYDIRVGTGQVVAGLDEGLKTMRVGGIRRIYVPGPLSFPKGLPAGPGRPRVPPESPVIFDVQLLYIPGLEMDE
jgi:peptidylprolyl isomerase